MFRPTLRDIAQAYVPGSMIAGKYRVERVLGEGAMGIVLAVRHVHLDELFALKFIRPDLRHGRDVMARFAREAKAASLIRSEHAAAVVDVGVSEPIGPYLVMEYLEGQDLEQALARGRLPVRTAVEYVLQACEGLATAHAAGITHRDVKPENLFLARRGDLVVVKLLDFGISKASLTGSMFGDELSVMRTSVLMGTPVYMSPEQIRATAEVDERTDIWSLGAVLYELLAGRVAFAAASITGVCALVLESEPEPLGRAAPGCPDGLSRVVSRCLEKSPARRYRNMAELSLALLPYAPRSARLYAERAAAILGDAQSLAAVRHIASTAPPPMIPPPSFHPRPGFTHYELDSDDDDGASMLPEALREE